MSVFLTIILLVAVFIGGYYLAIHIIKIWTGCDNNEATTKLHNFFNGTASCRIENDSAFYTEISDNICNIIGDKRFQRLTRLNSSMINTPLLFFDNSGKVPNINITVNYTDENEKLILENIICNVVKKFLAIYGYDTEIVSEWHIRSDLRMPYLHICYAKNSEQKTALRLYMKYEQNAVIESNTDLTDDTETDDLNG